MAARGGQVLTFGRDFLLSRLPQTGPAEPNLNKTKLYETGNAQSTGETRDIPNVTQEVRSLDMSTDFEELLLGLDPGTISIGDEMNLADAVPLDIVAPWKNSLTDFDVNRGVITPYLNLESATYRFGVRSSAEQSFSFRGDSIYYVTEGVPRFQRFAAAGVGPYLFADDPAVVTVEQGDNVFAYSACLHLVDGTVTRLYHGEDYTDDDTGLTLTEAAPGGSFLHVTYAGPGPVEFPQSIHPSTSVKPGDIRPSNIDIYVSDGASTPELVRMRGVQQFEVTQRFAREPDEELGNSHYVAYDFETPEVSGSMTMRPVDIAYLMQVVAQILGVPVGQTGNLLSDVPLDIEAVIRHPLTGATLKTIAVDDARFNPPGVNVQANSKLEQQFSFTSDTGDMRVIRGDRAA